VELQNKFHTFSYDAYTYSFKEEKLCLQFDYRLIGDDTVIPFCHKVEYDQVKGISFKEVDFSRLEGMIFHIGLVETINYWKLACPKELVICCGQLEEQQINWWKKLFYHGLGEFIYLNKIADLVDEDDFINIRCDSNKAKFKSIKLVNQGNLIPVGGGKDSVVTLEVLSSSKEVNLPFVMSPPLAAYDCIKKAGYHEYLEARRIFDKRMLLMNQEGYLNGHVPFSAILAFISVFGAALTGKSYIPLSNERSANEPSVIGTTFNHQYSKSFEFEKDFDWYLHHFITETMTYFSLLRPLYEIQIGEMFAKYRKYHSVYRSCNRGKSKNIWCGSCPKCLFVYIILSPYINRDELIKQFGKDLLNDEALVPIFEELIGIKDTKPFECVGTIWEVHHALNETIKLYDDAKLLQYYQSIGATMMNAEPMVYEEGDLLPLSHMDLLKREMKRIGISGKD